MHSVVGSKSRCSKRSQNHGAQGNSIQLLIDNQGGPNFKWATGQSQTVWTQAESLAMVAESEPAAEGLRYNGT